MLPHGLTTCEPWLESLAYRVDSGLTGSLESLVLGAEQIRWVKQFIKGLHVSDETPAIQAISGVGPGGHFLEHAHTLKHLRQTVWTPYVTDREEYDKWVIEGAKDYATRARKYATELMHSHQPQVVNESVRATLPELCNTRRPPERGAQPLRLTYSSSLRTRLTTTFPVWCCDSNWTSIVHVLSSAYRKRFAPRLLFCQTARRSLP